MQEVETKKVGRVKGGWLMAKSAWNVLKLDKELNVFPFISGATTAVVGLAALVAVLILAPGHTIHSGNMPTSSYVVGAVALVIITLMATYTAAALVAAALIRFRGGDPTVRDGFRAVKKRFWSLTVFALFNLGIVQILRYLEDRLPLAGKILAYFADIAWSVASIFAVPVIVESDKPVSPIAATKESTKLIRKAWGETAISSFSVGIAFLMVFLLEIVIGVGSIAAVVQVEAIRNWAAPLLGFLLVVAFFGTVLVASTLSGIVRAALYHYASTGEAPEHFSKELAHQAFKAKKARKLFV